MGGSSTTVGYRYFLGAQFIISHSVDAVLALDVDDRNAWNGEVTANTLVDIDKPDLFGGEDSEGGVSGVMEVNMGAPTQGASAYVEAKSGQLQPGHRGLLSLVFRGRSKAEIAGVGLDQIPFVSYFYGGVTTAAYVGKSGFYWAAMNPYIKQIAVTVRRILNGWTSAVWYPEKARIGDGMNPAHILYQCLTDLVWGAGLPTSLIDDTVWRAAADQLYTEGMGLSFEWSTQDTMDAFITDVMRHIDCALNTDFHTGKFVLKLIRNDYDPATLVHFSDDNITEVTEFDRPGWGETVNEVVVNYTNPQTNQLEPVVVHDLANIQIQQAVVSQPQTYAGIRDTTLAYRVAQRDLDALSHPLLKMTFITNRVGWDVYVGEVVMVAWSRRGLDYTPMRVIDINRGQIDNGKMTFSVIQDKFALPAFSYGVGQPSQWTNPAGIPEAIDTVRLTEVPYYVLNQLLGSSLESSLSTIDSCPLIMAKRPALQNARFTAYESVDSAFATGQKLGNGDYTPVALLNGGIAWNETALSFDTLTGDITHMEGGFALIEDEWISLTVVDDVAGELTVKRGCLDSVPVAHADNARIWFYSDGINESGFNWITPDATGGETRYYRETGRSLSSETDVTTAPQQTHVHLASWQAPYPPANVQLDGSYYPSTVNGNFVITWNGRNRLQQTVGLIGWTEGNIDPEDGQSYTLEVYDADTDTLISHVPGLSVRSAGGSYQFPGGGSATHYRIVFYSVRGNVRSIQQFEHTCIADQIVGPPPPSEVPPGSLTFVPKPVWVGGAYRSFYGQNFLVSNDNGVTWVQDVTSGNAGVPIISAIAPVFVHGNSIMLGYNSGNTYLGVKPDGAAWTTYGTGSGNLSTSDTTAQVNIDSIVFDGALFVMLRGNGREIWTSPDGALSNWTKVGGSENPVFALAEIRKITVVAGQYIAYGSKQSGVWPTLTTTISVVTSTDLVAWVATAIPVQFIGANFAPYFGGSWFLLINAQLYTSTDMLTWSAVDVGFAIPSALAEAGQPPLLSSGKLQFLMQDQTNPALQCSLATSSGTTWTLTRVALQFTDFPAIWGGKSDPNLAEDGGPSLFYRVGSPVEFGGRLFTIDGYESLPASRVYPSTDPFSLSGYYGDPRESYAGDIGNPSFDDAGLTMRGATSKTGVDLRIPKIQYSGKHYLEVTLVKAASGFGDIQRSSFYLTLSAVGGTDLAPIFVVGRSPVDFAPKVGDVLGFLLNMDDATAEIQLNGARLRSISGIDTTKGWIFSDQLQSGTVYLHLNVGQESYLYMPTGYSSWL